MGCITKHSLLLTDHKQIIQHIFKTLSPLVGSFLLKVCRQKQVIIIFQLHSVWTPGFMPFLFKMMEKRLRSERRLKQRTPS